MSAKGSRSDYMILAGLALVCVIFALAAGLSGTVPQGGDVRDLFRTTRSANVEGTIVFYTLLERLGARVHRSEKPLLEDGLEGTAVLFLINPAVPVMLHERDALRDWVRNGGVLVCAESGAGALSDLSGIDHGQGSRSTVQWDKRLDFTGTATGVPEEQSGFPLARDVSRLHFCSFRTLALPQEDPDDNGKQVQTLLADTAGVRVAGMSVGKGYAIVLSDSSFLANGWIGKERNATAAVNLAWYAMSRAGGGRLAFDEYHFGFGAHESGFGVLSDLLLHTSPGWAVLSLTFAGLLFLVYRGRRFGTRRAPPPERRRSKLEYIYSVGSAYRSAAANRLTLRLVYDWFIGRSARHLGLPRSAAPQDVAGGLARRAGQPPERYRAVVRACQDALRQGKLSGHRMSKLLSALGRIESEAFDATRRGT